MHFLSRVCRDVHIFKQTNFLVAFQYNYGIVFQFPVTPSYSPLNLCCHIIVQTILKIKDLNNNFIEGRAITSTIAYFLHTSVLHFLQITHKKMAREWIGNRGLRSTCAAPPVPLCTISLKTKVKHGMTQFPCWRAGTVNTMEWGLTGVQNWHKGRDVIRLHTSLSACYV